MEYYGEIAKGGFGYLLFVASLAICLPVIYYMWKKVVEQYEKRMEEANKFKDITLGTLEKQTDAISNLQRVGESNTILLQEIKYRK